MSMMTRGVWNTVILVLAAIVACSPAGKLAELKSSGVSAEISLPDRNLNDGFPINRGAHRPDTLTVTDAAGNGMILMRAIRDDESGEMVANEEIDAAVVTARFRHAAERHGRVNLEFSISVPEKMQDSRWQIRLHPRLFIQSDTLQLDDILVTGEAYRAAQLRGYEQYERFLSRIVTDSGEFLDTRNLEIFLKRNMPEVYAFRNDSSYVSDGEFLSKFGVSEPQAIEHYTDWFAIWRNDRRIGRMEKMRHRCIKAPIVTEHIRLDTIIRAENGTFIYNYVQTVHTDPWPDLRKAEINMAGAIFEQDKAIYNIPVTEPLTFYISSLSSLVDKTEHYLSRIVERRVEACFSWHIDFRCGKYVMDPDLGENRENISQISRRLSFLLSDEEIELDSITIRAYASPEGPVRSNRLLSAKRAAGVADYFERYVKQVSDSISAGAGIHLALGDSIVPESMPQKTHDAVFRTGSSGENWSLLDALVADDANLNPEQKSCYFELAGIQDLDARERKLSLQPSYHYIRETLYPRLRTVDFDCRMHRKGMVADTLITSEPDTAYMKAVKLLEDRRYAEALEILSPYRDFNTAVACLSLDLNATAMDILEGLPSTAAAEYLKAIVHSRLGEEQNAIQCYLNACALDRSFRHRGNLDPEISSLLTCYSNDIYTFLP